MTTKTDPICRCCSMPARGPHAAARVCQLCAICSSKHGAALYERLNHAVMTGAMSPYTVLAAVALDDAWLTGNATLDEGGIVQIGSCPKRWEVALAHCRIANVQPALETIMGAALAPFMHKVAGPAIMAEAKREIRAALVAFNPALFDLEIEVCQDAEHGLYFKVQSKIATSPEVMPVAHHDVELPADIFSRPRGQA